MTMAQPNIEPLICEGATENVDSLSLPARIHPLIKSYIDKEKETITDLIDAFGSPFNLMFPQIIDENIKSFQEVYKKNNLSGKVFFTSKPNKSFAVMRQASTNDVCIDVSSEKALHNALNCGFHSSRIECTGPKNKEYLLLAIQHDVIINADNLAELKQAIEIKKALRSEKKLKVFVRLSGFNSDRVSFTSLDGTFGENVDDADTIFEFLQNNTDDLDFLGFAYYWSNAQNEQLVVALENAIELTLKAVDLGLEPKGLNIGGGFHVQYAENRCDWLEYIDQFKKSLLDNTKSMSWNDNGLGFRVENGLIKGAPNYVDHCSVHNGAVDFDHIITSPLPSFDGMSAAEILSDCMLELYIEPGRALLDQLGVTVGRVNFTKKSVNGETLVALDMNRSNMHSTHQKLLTDPIIIYQDEEKNKDCPEGVYFYGNLCVSYDIITYQKVFPSKLPRNGDLVIFVNTAAYIMDFIESTTLHQNVAEKVCIIKNDETYKWFKDDKYKPALHQNKREGLDNDS